MSVLAGWPYPRWIAHRGAGKLAPENTMAAFRLGAQHGYRMFECDAKLSRDDVAFLLHDATLERTTSGKGAAGDMAWDALAALDAGSWHSPAHRGEPVATLEALATFCLANGYFLNIEIKPTPGTETATGAAVANLARNWWAGQAVKPLLTSFQRASLQSALDTAPDLPRGLLLDKLDDGWLADARRLQCAAVICKHVLWDAAAVRAVHEAGMKCLSYTVNDEPSAQRLWKLGTDGIITDRVDLFRPD